MIKKKKSKCHFDRPYYCKDLCKSCYNKVLAKKNKNKISIFATCHTNKKHKAFGLCSKCYRKRYNSSESGKIAVRKYKKSIKGQATIRERDWKKLEIKINFNDYIFLFKKQGGLCKICNSISVTKNLAIDHNHKTGNVRGLLCIPCNLKLGWYEKNKIKIDAYLEEGAN